jgi:putative transposase
MKYVFIERERTSRWHAIWPVRVMCKVLSVHRSGFYAWQLRSKSVQLGKRVRENQELSVAIREIHARFRQCYGAPRMTRELQRLNYRCSRGRVARLMKANGIKAIQRRRYTITTRSNHGLANPNVLDRGFGSFVQPDRGWTSDITYVWTQQQEWIYVATVMDLYSRKIVGLAMGPDLSSELVCDALWQAIAKRNPKAGLLLHSDRGSQYSAWDYRTIIKAHGFEQSMSRKGNCWDNAPMESFFKTMKVEEVYRTNYKTHAEAQAAIFDYIEVFYNRQRMHSAINYMTPEAFEAQTQTSSAT